MSFDRPALWSLDWFAEAHSMGHVNRNTLTRLAGVGVDIHLHRPDKGVESAYESVYYSFPNHAPRPPYVCLCPFLKPYQLKQQTGATHTFKWAVLDNFSIGKTETVDDLRAFDALLTPSRFSADYFAQNGLKAHVVPHGVDRQIFRPNLEPIDLASIFGDTAVVFGKPDLHQHKTILVAGMLQRRKAIGPLVDAFNVFFHDGGGEDWTLLIKGVNSHWGHSSAFILKEIEAHNKGANILYSEVEVSDKDFPRLLVTVDMLAAPSHIEGFGLVPLQAMACDTPVVLTDWGGHREYATAANASLIPVTPKIMPDFCGTAWGYFSSDVAATAIADAAVNGNSKSAARLATAEKMSWERSVATFQRTIETVCGKPLRQHEASCSSAIVAPPAPRVIVDPIGVAAITMPEPIVCKRALFSVVSPGYEGLLDVMLTSLEANGGVEDARRFVFCANADGSCLEVIRRHNAVPIYCKSLQPSVDAKIKSLMYSAAEVVQAESYLCLDADLVVLERIGAIFEAIESHNDAVFITAEIKSAEYKSLRGMFQRVYGDPATLDSWHLSDWFIKNPLCINDGVFAGCAETLNRIADRIRTLPKPLHSWALSHPIGNQLLFNLAVLEEEHITELGTAFNGMLYDTMGRDEIFRDGNRLCMQYEGKRVYVAHLSGFGKAFYPRFTPYFDHTDPFASFPTPADRTARDELQIALALRAGADCKAPADTNRALALYDWIKTNSHKADALVTNIALGDEVAALALASEADVFAVDDAPVQAQCKEDITPDLVARKTLLGNLPRSARMRIRLFFEPMIRGLAAIRRNKSRYGVVVVPSGSDFNMTAHEVATAFHAVAPKGHVLIAEGPFTSKLTKILRKRGYSLSRTNCAGYLVWNAARKTLVPPRLTVCMTDGPGFAARIKALAQQAYPAEKVRLLILETQPALLPDTARPQWNIVRADHGTNNVIRRAAQVYATLPEDEGMLYWGDDAEWEPNFLAEIAACGWDCATGVVYSSANKHSVQAWHAPSRQVVVPALKEACALVFAHEPCGSGFWMSRELWITLSQATGAVRAYPEDWYLLWNASAWRRIAPDVFRRLDFSCSPPKLLERRHGSGAAGP